VNSLINSSRPRAFCAGCLHAPVIRALDQALSSLDLKADRIALVSDIGCSGLLDTFFNTHALHGLHGRALTYAAGLKLSRPELSVVAAMGDGGIGIGGAHLIAACRRNIDITLLVLNNFTFGMTGGQYSPTTPCEATVNSAFLNQLEKPLDICRIAAAAGAPYVARCSGYEKDLADHIQRAVAFEGFSVLDIWGICTGRNRGKGSFNPSRIQKAIEEKNFPGGPVRENLRPEYVSSYRKLAATQKPAEFPLKIRPQVFTSLNSAKSIVILGRAGQGVVAAGEILCLSAMLSGLRVSQKNQHDITVMTGPSISEVILSKDNIGFTGIEKPDFVLALAEEGVRRKKNLFDALGPETIIIQSKAVEIPACRATIVPLDFSTLMIPLPNQAIAMIAILARKYLLIRPEELDSALKMRFVSPVLDALLMLSASLK